MANPTSAEWYRQHYTDISGQLTFTTSQDDATLVTGKAGWTIFIQRIIVWIDTSAAQSMQFEDSAGTPIEVANIPASPGADTRWDFDFGARGMGLTEAKNFMLDVSAPGNSGHLHYEGYLRQTGTEYIRNAGTLGTGQAFA